MRLQRMHDFMPRKIPFVVFVLCSVWLVVVAGCASVPEDTLAVVRNDTIRTGQFESAYLQSRTAPPQTDSQRVEFLNLLIDYRVKLQEAREKGYDRDADLLAEYHRYRDQIAVSYLLERHLVEPAIRLLFQRRAEEIGSSYILVRIPKMGSGELDTLSAFNRGNQLLAEVRKSKEPFDSLITKYSEDQRKDEFHGRIEPLIAGEMEFPEFDDLIYSLKEGEIASRLLRSPFGYHIIKVTHRQKARQRVRASQILYRLDLKNPLDTSAGFARLSLILDSLNRGLATFEELARRNSQDPVSGEKGGDLGWIERGTNLEPRFETALFNLRVGETSRVIRSAFGMHIIKMTDESLPRNFEQQKPDLKSIYRRQQFAKDYIAYIKELLARYRYTPSVDVLNMILTRIDSSTTTSTPGWEYRLNEKDKDAYFFRLNDKPYTVRQAIEEIRRDPVLQMRNFTRKNLDTIALSIAERMALVEETKGFEEKYPDFAAIVKEFFESSLITKAEQNEVWSTVKVSEAEMRAYWERNKEQYSWPKRVAISEIYVYTPKEGNFLLDSLKAGVGFNELASRHTRRAGYYTNGGRWGLQPYDKNELTIRASMMNVGETSELIMNDVGCSIIHVDGKEDARLKTFDEARTEIESRMHEEALDRSMRAWLKSLREKYGVIEYPEHLKMTFRTKPAVVNGTE